jgi:uncharacterized protein YwqG
MTKQKFLKSLNELGLEKLAVKIEPTLRNAISLNPIECKDIEIEIGQSKLGGKPDLPETIDWAKDQGGASLAFVGQINLEEVEGLDTENLLPKTGILYFFYDATQEFYGEDLAQKDKFRVIYYDGDLSLLKRNNFPSDLPKNATDVARFSAAKINPKKEISFPSNGDKIYDKLKEKDFEKFEELTGDELSTKLLGYSNNLQNPMEMDCELITNGIDLDNYESKEAKALEPNFADWKLLLQVDSCSDGEGSMDFAGGGVIYYWIKKDDLLNKNFDKAWFSMQCY